MELLHVHDGSDEVRVEICGDFTGQAVEQLREIWKGSQLNEFWRRFVVNISAIGGYDRQGHQLLHELYQCGAVFAAATPQSLDFLEEIASGNSVRTGLVVMKRAVERSPSSRPRHRAGVGAYEAKVRSL